jgi:NAD(P)-dependent dehydrogenase (short-subunit alcohol dehydrogenase family)
MDIAGQTALVTGGGSGLGAATARLLSRRGAQVIVFDRDEAAAHAIAQETGGIAVSGDVTSPEDVEQAIAAAAEPPRIVVNCAGIGPPGRVVGREGPLPLETFETVIRVNLLGTFNVCRLAAAALSEAGLDGVIVNTASVAAFEGQIGQAAYAASKGGIVSMALPMAREFARFGIRVNTIAPGIFMTPLLGTLPTEAQEALASGIPYPARLGQPEEFARTVCYCVEMDYLNGEVIRLDGATRLPPK